MTNVSKALLYYYDSVSKKYKLISDMENTDIKKFIPKVEIYWFDELTNSYKPLVTDGTLPLSGDGGSFDPSLLLDYAKKDYVNDSIGILETYIGSVYATKDYVVTEIEKLNLEEMFLKKSDALALYASNSSIGDLSQLTTTDKTNLVNAINEVKISGTGGEGVDLSGYATKNELDNKVDKIAGKTLSTNDYTTADKEKLAGIAEGATKTIVEDSVTSTSTTNSASAKSVKEAYDLANSKANTDVATTTNNGLMSNVDKSKLDSVATGANNYTLPISSSTAIGGVKIQANSGLDITIEGTLSATNLKNKVDTHVTDDVKHITTTERDKWNTVGTVANLRTTEKTDIVSAVNELFTNVSDGKSSLATAITAKGQNITGDSTFAELTSAINNISTGKKFATGITTPVRKTHTRYGQETSNIPYALQINGLGFIPTIIIYKSPGGVSYDSYIYFKNGFAYGEEVWSFKNSEGICYASNTAIISKDLIDIPSETLNAKEWYAFE